MWERRDVYRFWWKPEGKRPIGRPRHRWEDNINTLRTGIFSSIFIIDH
jgi:hypothetical protein